ncbi:hypothetical protein [Novosphingobium album (ex Liu et al. 2023)]|uniref:Uncharacterized protein n=1 Tax=Novosphingobium album (ex Liu et al. 2023) TaxID=3031130 RepID=A0ABT5WNJ5_9SPHN|nr:hypothetical protein [Novosphingobium album (ex Liu et al. 2023)]MDE8651615.1 hypothetical protein [Novosphingobium album (ex Liu et al. 2023)]
MSEHPAGANGKRVSVRKRPRRPRARYLGLGNVGLDDLRAVKAPELVRRLLRKRIRRRASINRAGSEER